MSSVAMVSLDDGIKHRSEPILIAKAIKNYLDVQEWQINEIRKGIEEADRGELVSHEKVKAYWKKKCEDKISVQRYESANAERSILPQVERKSDRRSGAY